MKRKCLIEVYDGESLDIVEKKAREISIKESKDKMYKNCVWFKSLQAAEKSCLNDNKVKKIHYKFEDEGEMVEEYNVDTQVMLRRAWKVRGKLGGEGKWEVEIGDPIQDPTPNMEAADILESKDQPSITIRNTRINLEWRIRNLPYPIETYSISANNEEKCIVVRTTNKKYFKKLQVPALIRFNLPFEQANIQASHKYNTLIITYKKPQLLLDMEKEWFKEVEKIKPNNPNNKDIPNDCKTQ